MVIHHFDDGAVAPDGCWDLLRSAVVGRLAVWSGDRPEIFPINYIVDRGTIVFRTAPGKKLDSAIGHQLLAFEADGYDTDSDLAWSVVVHGKAEMLTNFDEVVDASALPLFPCIRERKEYSCASSPNS